LCTGQAMAPPCSEFHIHEGLLQDTCFEWPEAGRLHVPGAKEKVSAWIIVQEKTKVGMYLWRCVYIWPGAGTYVPLPNNKRRVHTYIHTYVRTHIHKYMHTYGCRYTYWTPEFLHSTKFGVSTSPFPSFWFVQVRLSLHRYMYSPNCLKLVQLI
jgi:hypothetical protein